MNKPHLILLHGAIGDSKQLLPIKILLEKDFEVHTMNFSGHGGRPYKPTKFGIDTFVSDVLEYMDEHELERSYIFGYSMGGYVALNLIRQGFGDRVIKLFTLATKVNWTPEAREQEKRNSNPAKIEEKVPKFAEILKNRHAPNDWKELVTKTAVFLEDMYFITDADYKNIETPITIGVGTEDTLVSVEEAEHVARILPNGHFKIFEGFKHPIEQVDTQVLCKEILRFFLAKELVSGV